MIRGLDLFGREPVSPNEKKILKSANKTAQTLYSKRSSIHLRDHWGKEVSDITMQDVEDMVVCVIKEENTYGTQYGKKIIC